MMNMKIIKTEYEYEQALARAETLMDAVPGSSEEDGLELIGLLIEKYEDEHYPIDPPDPVDAILFRMEQQGLTPKDMIKYLGSQSRVSEVLNRKRPLSLAMIRNLHDGLDIPLEVLIGQTEDQKQNVAHSWKDFPFAIMVKRGYFPNHKNKLSEAKKKSPELLGNLLAVLGDDRQANIYYRLLADDFNANALKAWQARITHIALEEKLPSFTHNTLSRALFRQIVKLSYFNDGPRLAKELLNKKGIHVIFLSQLPKTYLDGACFYAPDHHPVIGMTLRHDRLDNFWFTIIHELAHIYLHLNNPELAFFDNTEQWIADTNDPHEQAANLFTKETLIPGNDWEKINNSLEIEHSTKILYDWANKLEISPAIIAGRIRWETKDYSIFSRAIGNKQVRQKFPEYDSA
jgi:HTH-type transcriptional regulator/antitoxin HigA